MTATLRLSDRSDEQRPASKIDLVVIRDDGTEEVIPVVVRDGICTYARSEPPTLQSVSCWWQGEDMLFRLVRQGGELQVLTEQSERPLASIALEGAELNVVE